MRAPQLRKEDCNGEMLKKTTYVIGFRQWVRTFELRLEAHYGWTYADFVVQAIPHEEKPITHGSFADLI